MHRGWGLWCLKAQTDTGALLVPSGRYGVGAPVYTIRQLTDFMNLLLAWHYRSNPLVDPKLMVSPVLLCCVLHGMFTELNHVPFISFLTMLLFYNII